MAPFSVIVFGVVASVDDSRIRSKTALFSFENGLLWTGPYKKNPVELKRCETSSSYMVFHLMKLKPQKERLFLILKYDYVT